MHEGMVGAPIPLRDDNVALNSRRTRRLYLRRFAFGNPVCPIREHLQRIGSVQTRCGSAHTATANTRLQTIVPSLDGGLQFGFCLEDVIECAGDRVAELMAEVAARLERMHPAFERLLGLSGT